MLINLIQQNACIEKSKVLLDCITLFTRANYLFAEEELEGHINAVGDTLDPQTLLGEMEDKMEAHLTYMLNEFGIYLTEDANQIGLYRLSTLVTGIMDLVDYENMDDLLDTIESEDDDTERLVNCLDLVILEMDTGNVLDYYEFIDVIEDSLWTNLMASMSDKKDVTDYFEVADTINNANLPSVTADEDIQVISDEDEAQTSVKNWVLLSGRVGYSLDAAFTYLESSLLNDLSPDERWGVNEINRLTMELITLMKYSSTPTKTDPHIFMGLVEKLTYNPSNITDFFNKSNTLLLVNGE